MTTPAHANGFITYDEMKLVIEALDLLGTQYSDASANANNPQSLRALASRHCRECFELRKTFAETEKLRR